MIGEWAFWGQRSESLLWCIRDAFVQRREAGQQHVALVLFALPEFVVCAMEPIQHAEHTITLVEPGSRKCCDYCKSQI